jgi:hypothetical protein
MLKLDASTAAVGGFAEYRQDQLTPEQIRAEVMKPETTLKRIQELWPVVNRSFPAVEVDGERLLDTLKREGDKRVAAEKQQRQQAAVTTALTPEELKALGDWADAIDSITCAADSEVVESDLAEAEQGGRLDEVKAAAIRKAIQAKVAVVARPAAA